jgi:hypothetical protein
VTLLITAVRKLTIITEGVKGYAKIDIVTAARQKQPANNILLVGYTRGCMRSSASHAIHINVPFITYDNYLFSIICLFSGLLLL